MHTFSRLLLTGLSLLKLGAASQSCPFEVKSFVQRVGVVCNAYIQAIQARNASIPTWMRVEAAVQLQQCQNAVANATFTNNSTIIVPRPIEILGNTSYHDYYSYINPTCAFQINLVDGKCMKNQSNSLLSKVLVDVNISTWTRFKRCIRELPLQYVRCTHQKSKGDLATCIQHAERVDWLKQISSYDGADTCPVADTILYKLAFSVVVTTVVSLLTAGKLWKILQAKRRWKKAHAEQTSLSEYGGTLAEAQPWLAGHDLSKGPSVMTNGTPATNGDYMLAQWQTEYIGGQQPLQLTPPDPSGDDSADPEPRIFRPAHTFQMTAYGMIFSLGTEVLTSYLTALVIAGHKTDTTKWFLRDLAFYIIRPRAAPLIGTFGLFEPWYKKGLDVLVVDGVISYLAGTWIGLQFMIPLVTPPKPANPSAPAKDLKVLVAGAILTFSPALIVQVLICFYSIFEVLRQDWRGRKCGDEISRTISVILSNLLMIAIFFAIMPFVAVWELYVIVRNFKIFRKDKPKRVLPFTIVASQTLLGFMRFDRFYWFFLVSSWVINIGNWIFFASYLKLEGELYCPSDMAQVFTIWYVVPAVAHGVLGGLQGLTGDQ